MDCGYGGMGGIELVDEDERKLDWMSGCNVSEANSRRRMVDCRKMMDGLPC